MVFSSVTFLFFFLPLVLAVYYCLPGRFHNFVLLVFSLLFYSWGEPVYVVLMLLSTAGDFVFGKLAVKYREEGNLKKARGAVLASVIFNLGMLGFFKYSNFFVDMINQAAGTSFVFKEIPLPIGISFYTFQTMSYTIDVYRGDAKVQKNILDFGTYVTMFPQLIAGPIVRYQAVADQLNHRKETADKFAEGIRRFSIGMGKKVLLANQMGEVFQAVRALPEGMLSVSSLWVGILAFSFQIYFDFSGYSDMAIGLGLMFGFRFPENFNYPYCAKSITDFWRRWHMTLGEWFREYVYIPLGGNRRGLAIQLRNILIVWFLTGFWHGASWNFILWGLYFGLILLLEKTFLLKWLNKIPAFFQHVYALILIVFGWVIFAFENIGELLQRIKELFGFGGLPFWNGQTAFYLVNFGLLFVLCALASTPVFRRWRGAIFLLLLSIAYLAAGSYNPFLYFRF
ncbi:MBOAT family O-acyltransferase [Anaerolentibacter hominis]|uniref:MBOAT family O-acyltransferase n=1 Tax=Anaerolentibacter hominis TaxID=3079009 RepID=UPI0031B88BA5